jgi:NAD(P)-dependent dehydrogenase (short-subunit alcohol dehydrogenase family)
MKSKIFLIIGGRSAIAQALIKSLLGKGHQVIATSREKMASQDPLMSWQYFDAENPSSLDLPDTLDGVAYFPGSITLKPFQRMKPDEFMKEFQVNALGAAQVLQQCFKPLKKNGHSAVVLFSTVAVQMGMGFHSSIAMAKGALEGLTRSLAAEWAGSIRVNALAPSLTDTPLAASLLSTEEKRIASLNRHPTKSLGDPKDLAAMAEFLLNEEAKFMTGQILGMDGGLSSVKTFI